MKSTDESGYPSTFEELNWRCPAMMVDYVRHYEPAMFNSTARHCPNVDTSDSDQIRADICARLMAEMAPGFSDRLSHSIKSVTSVQWGKLYHCYILN